MGRILTNGLIDKQWDKIMMLGLDPFVHPVVISEAIANEAPNRSKLWGIKPKR